MTILIISTLHIVEMLLLFLILLNLLELLHLHASLHHAEEVLREIQEHQRCPLDQLNIDHVVCRKFTDFTPL